jgi:hypothetical protein
VADVAHERERDQQLDAAEKPINHNLRVNRALLCNPLEYTL